MNKGKEAVGGVAPGVWNSAMQRIDAGYVYEAGEIIRSLKGYRLKDTEAYELWGPVTRARNKVQEFLQQSVYAQNLRVVKPAGLAFINAADALLERIRNEKLTTVHGYLMVPLFEAFDKFEPVLSSELSSQSAYLVVPKGAYDVSILIETGERMFPESLAFKVPEALFDAKEGSKALAFDLWTSAAFHFHRSNESVLRRYFDHVAGVDNRPDPVTMGTMLGTLKQLKLGDKRIIAALDNIKQFHRNPIAHPGENLLSVDECLSLVAAVRASMGYMLDAIPA